MAAAKRICGAGGDGSGDSEADDGDGHNLCGLARSSRRRASAFFAAAPHRRMPRFYGARPSSCASAPRSTPSAAPRSSSQIFALFDDALAESAPPARPPHTPAWPPHTPARAAERPRTERPLSERVDFSQPAADEASQAGPAKAPVASYEDLHGRLMMLESIRPETLGAGDRTGGGVVGLGDRDGVRALRAALEGKGMNDRDVHF